MYIHNIRMHTLTTYITQKYTYVMHTMQEHILFVFVIMYVYHYERSRIGKVK